MALNKYGWFLDGHPSGLLVPVSSGYTLTAGKYYWEVTIDQGGADGTNGYGIIAGIATSAASLYGIVATALNQAQSGSQYGAFINTRVNPESANGWGYPNRPGGISSGGATAAGQVFGFALDCVNNRIWWRNLSLALPINGKWAGGANEAGDPATTLYGALLIDIINSAQAYYIICGASHGSGSVKGVGTINFGASAFTGTPPTGFSSVYSVFPGAALNPNDNSNIVLSNGNLTFSGELVPVTFSPPIGGFTTNLGYTNAVRSRFSIAHNNV